MATNPKVTVRGLDPLLRDLGRASKELAKEVRGELKDGPGEVVAAEARRILKRKGHVKTGKAAKRTKPTVRRNTVIVRNTAVRKGFPYPTVLEYAGRGSSEFGPRAFLGPAIDSTERQVEEAFEDIVAGLFEKVDRLE